VICPVDGLRGRLHDLPSGWIKRDLPSVVTQCSECGWMLHDLPGVSWCKCSMPMHVYMASLTPFSQLCHCTTKSPVEAVETACSVFI
jgi:hypothetical protein